MENTTPRATPNPHAPPSKLRFMCSYNGHILPRPHDKTLTYMGGDTRLITLNHTNATLQTLISQILKTTSFDKDTSFVIKYQLPNEDLDSLVSVSTDEDLEYMIDEYFYYLNNSNNRLRLFLFPRNSDSVVESVKSIGSVLLEGSQKSEEVFVRGLNGRLSSCLSFCSDNSLLGLDDDVIKGNGEVIKETEKKVVVQDVVEVPEFGSVPDSPVKVNGEVNYVAVQAVEAPVVVAAKVVGNGLGQRVSSGGFDMASPDSVSSDGSLTNPLSRRNPTVIYQDAATQTQYSNNNNNGVTHDPNTRIQMQQQQIHAASQTQYSDNNNNGVTHDPNTRIQMQQQHIHAATQPQYSNNNNNGVIDDQNSRAQMQQQQIHDSAYLRSTSTAAVTTTTTPTDLQHPQAHQQHQLIHTADPSSVSDQNTRIHLQQQQIQDSASLTSTAAATKPDLQNPQVHQQHQFIHTAVPPPQYIHHHPSGAVPMPSYYPLYPPQNQHHAPISALDQRKIVYYMPVIAAPPNSQVPTPSSLFTTPRTAQPASNPESPVYRTNSSGASGPQFVQVPSSQHQHQPQYLAYSHLQQPSQAVASSGGTVHPSSKPESPVYRTNSSDASGPQFVQFPSSQHQHQHQHQHQPQPQYLAYSHIQQPSQPVASSGGSGGNYAYEFADLSEKGQLIYYAAQPMPPQSSAQYQTTSSNLPVEGGSHIQTESSMNQQVKTSQP